MSNLNASPIAFALPSIGEEEIQAVNAVLRSGWLTTGVKTKQFEKDFADFVEAKHAIAVNSATAGLHLALDAIGIKAGDQVLTTPYTFTATAEVIRYLGADPIFVDIDSQTFNIDPKEIAKHAGNKKIKAIIPVHFAGQSCNMSAIKTLAVKNNWKIIEDAAHALPSTYQGDLVGNFADISVYSFYATKTIATGEGGMITTNHSEYIQRMKTMRLHGISTDVFDRYVSNKPKWYYEIIAPGYKYNMTDIAATLGIQQLKKAWQFQERRQWIAKKYHQAFQKLPLKMPYISHPNDVHSWHLYVIQLELDKLTIDRNRFIELMSEAGVGTSVHFIPLHIQPYWRDKYHLQANDFPVALNVYQQSVSLPIYPKMTDVEVERVIYTVKDILGRVAR